MVEQQALRVRKAQVDYLQSQSAGVGSRDQGVAMGIVGKVRPICPIADSVPNLVGRRSVLGLNEPVSQGVGLLHEMLPGVPKLGEKAREFTAQQ